MDSGVHSGSRIGFKGMEDLGNGLKAGFVLETGLHADDGSLSHVGTFGRQSFLTLGGDFGTVGLGRQYSPAHLLGVATDPFGKGTVGQMHNVYAIGAETRLANLVAYASPNWGGFSFIAGYTLNANQADESAGNESATGDMRAWTLQPTYRNGPLMLGFNIHELKLASTDDGRDGEKVRVYDLMGTYDFGATKIAVAYGQRRASDVIGDFSAFANRGVEKSSQWLVGITLPLGAADKVMASYSQRTSELIAGGSDPRSTQWALGYEHAVSKRTALYATYARISNNDAAEDSKVISSIGDNTHVGNGYQAGMNFGLKHMF